VIENFVMIGDTMETDIRGAVEAGLESFLVLTGSTRLENVGDYVYQPTSILQSVADLIQEVKTGTAAERLKSPAFVERNGALAKFGQRHQTDTMMFHKPRPRPAMTK
jgi:NagD protein